jgi:ADP-ribose pyrophosphatase
VNAAGGIHGVPEENEDIRVRVLSSTQAWQALQEGRMNNAMAIIALQWLMMNRDSLRAQASEKHAENT